MTSVRIEQGDLTTVEVDAIVNAANNDLILGGGLAGAIARRGGPTIQEQCLRHGPVAVGQAAITGAGHLPCRWVIHAASMSLGGRTTEESLISSLRAVLALTETHDIRSLALPAIGTGIAGFPMERCASLTLAEIKQYLLNHVHLSEIVVVLFDESACDIFRRSYAEVFGRSVET